MDAAEIHAASLKNTLLDTQEARYRENFSYFSLLPSLSATGSYIKNQDPTIFSGGPSDDFKPTATYNYSLDASQPLSGLISGTFKIGQARHLKEAAFFTLKKQQIEIRLQAATDYLGLQEKYKTLDAQEYASRIAAQTVREVQVLWSTGEPNKTKIDVLLSEAALAKAKNDEENALAAVKQAAIKLGQELGVPLDEPLSVERESNLTLEKEEVRFPSLEQVLSVALNSDPSQAADAAFLRAKNDEISIQSWDFFPALEAFADYTDNRADFNASASFGSNFSRSQSLSFGIKAKWTLWNGAEREKEHETLWVQREKFKNNLQEDLEILKKNLATDILELHTAVNQVKNSKQTLNLNEQVYRLSREQFHEGNLSAKDFIQIQKNLVDAKTALGILQSRRDLAWLTLKAHQGLLP